MDQRYSTRTRRIRRWTGLRLVGLALLVLAGSTSTAQAVDCSELGGVLDGFAGDVAPSQIQIDQNCTIRNFPASNPLETNFSFLTQPGQTEERWLVVFDNVVHTGEMACNSVAGHRIWFTNGSSTSIQEGCQNLLIPVEKIDKSNPPGQSTAVVGMPFTYTLTLPVLFDAGTGTVINSAGSLNDLHGVTLWDDLNATGADLTYLGHVAYWRDTGTPVAHTFSNTGNALTFDDFPIIPAGDQIIVEITVVLDDTPANVPGTQFTNTAAWDFGRLIDGVFYEPLPGERGISDPLTIAAPELVVSKTGPATLGRTLNLGEWGEFTIDARNTGLTDAWNVTIVDLLPDGPAAGMCDLTPELLSARVFASDGVTPVPGKGPLIAGTDFDLVYSGAPACQLTLSMLTAASTIGPDERLVVRYRTQLDADTQDGATLTNVVGATEWFSADGANPDRQAYVRTITDGTVGVADHQDAHTVTAALFGYFFEKSVENLTRGISPTQTAFAGETLRYTLRLQATDVALTDLAFTDDLGELNPGAVFVPGSLSLVPGSVPPGADTSGTDPSGGTNQAGLLDVRNLGVAAGSEISVQFDVTLASDLTEGTVVLNQAGLSSGGVAIADSDDPNLNGQADPSIPGDEDPTRVVIGVPPAGPLLKAISQPTASVGESFTYRITVPASPLDFPIHDVRVTDDLGASAADLRLIGVTRISGPGSWTPVNTGTDTSLVIEDVATGIDIPAGEQAVIEIEVVLEDTPVNVPGLSFTNTASFVFNAIDQDPASQRSGDPGTSEAMTIVGPDLTLDKSGPATMTVGLPGSMLLNVQNIGDGPAWNATLTDRLPDEASGGTCDAPPVLLSAAVFEADGTTPVSGPLVEDTDFTVSFSGAPDCLFSFSVVSAAGTIGPDQRLIVSYETWLDVDTQDGATITNVAGATEWFSADGSDPDTSGDRRTFSRTLSDGTVGVLDHEDAHTLMTALPAYLFEKTVINLSTGADPALTASPGDRLRYAVHIENQGTTPLDDVRLLDELDRLNTPAAFEAGTLLLTTVPGGADSSATSSTGGAQGTGIVDIRDLTVGPGESALVEFEVTLAAVLANGALVSNQSQLLANDAVFALSDDPNVNGTADPFVTGDEDPTRVSIESAPDFAIEKVSTYLTGDPAVLLAGESLRYTITIRNVGTDDASSVLLRDAVPSGTQYTAGSTTLNGDPVPDGPGGSSPLADGILVHVPADPTPGSVPADASQGPDYTATVTFDVQVDADLIDGTIIANQGFVSSAPAGISDVPSDDPRTAIPDDPTRDVVGSFPLLFAPKTATLLVDAGTPGIVDPGDVLRYAIAIHNTGSSEATGAVLTDAVPASTTYVADSTTLNGLPVGRPDAGAFPLASGLPVSSSGGAASGTLAPGASALVEFDLRVDPGVPAGTLISNQARLATTELADLLTDGDGNPATGPEPTVVVVGSAQRLSIDKSVAVVGGGAALPGAVLEYVVRVVNVGAVPALDVSLSDDLDAPVAGQLTYVGGSALLNGSTAGISLLGSVLSADYSSTYGPLGPGETLVLRFRAIISAGLATGTTIANTAVVTWSDPPQSESDTVTIDVGGMPGVATLNGRLWHDADFDDAPGPGERALAGWTVELRRNGQPVHSIVVGADGSYSIGGVSPNDQTGDAYELEFRAPGAGPATAALGTAHSAFTDGLQRIGDIVLSSGANLQDLNLPIDPNGVVYDSITRSPVVGAVLTMLDAAGGSALPPGCFDDPAQQGQVTLASGLYKFDLNFSQASCPAGAAYVISVTPPVSGFVAGYSQMIPPLSDPSTPPFSVPACPGGPDDAVPITASHCESQVSELAPPTSVPARSAGTAYRVHLLLDASQPPGSSQIFNNHIPLDRVLDDALGITKTTPSMLVSRGELVPYEITISNEIGVDLSELTIVDRFPAGFRYVEGSARIDGVPTEPTINGRELVWTDLPDLPGASRRSLVLLLAAGAGVEEGEYVNRAQVLSSLTGAPLSGEATATVRITPDPTFDCTDVMGKVFDDANRNGVQDPGERGLQGVRLMTARGLAATTDAHGRYHITCAITPREGRGSNFLLKLDQRTLPTGFRMSTRDSQVIRATRGKAIRFNYGASIHRVIGLDMADPVFEPGSTRIRPQWRPRLRLLLRELQKTHATLRLSYIADVEDAALVNERLNAVKEEIASAWEAIDGYPLTIEPEVFWRRGGPVSPPASGAQR